MKYLIFLSCFFLVSVLHASCSHCDDEDLQRLERERREQESALQERQEPICAEKEFS